MKIKTHRKNLGYTLIELLIVLAFIVIGLGIIAFLGFVLVVGIYFLGKVW